MSTNKTQNYNLHSWVPQDEFHVSEINENFAAVDGALGAEAATLAQATAALAQKAQVVFGSYIGLGKATPLELGCVPKAMLVMRSTGTGATENTRHFGLLIPGLNNPGAVFEGTGVTLAGADHQILNYLNAQYHYILFL